MREMSANEPLMRCRKEIRRHQNWRLSKRQDKSRRRPVYCLGGVRHKGGMNLVQAFVWNVGSCRPDVKGEIQVEAPRG